MITPRRLLATLTALCLLAAACGTGEAENDAAEEQLAELEAQLAELREETDEDGRAPEDAEDAAGPETSQDAPEDDGGPEEADEAEEDEEPVTTEPSGGGGLVGEFAEPTGPLLSEDMGLAEIEELAASLLGRTTDVGGDLARLMRFPAAVVTMPGSEIVEVSAGWAPDHPQRSTKQGSSVEVTMLTNATPEDVVLTYETQLAAAGFGIKQSSSSSTATGPRYSLTANDATIDELTANLDVDTGSTEDGTTWIIIKWRDSDDGPGLATVANGWFGNGPIGEGAVFDHSTLKFGEGFIAIFSDFWYYDQTLDNFAASEDERFSGGDWTLVSSEPGSDTQTETATLPTGDEVESWLLEAEAGANADYDVRVTQSLSFRGPLGDG